MPTYRLLLAHDADEIVDFEVGGPPPAVTRYSVVLRHLDPAGNATAVRVYDNSHTPRRASHAQVRSTRAATAAAITTGSQRSQSSTPAVSGSPPMRTNMPPASSDSCPSGPATTTRSSRPPRPTDVRARTSIVTCCACVARWRAAWPAELAPPT